MAAIFYRELLLIEAFLLLPYIIAILAGGILLIKTVKYVVTELV